MDYYQGVVTDYLRADRAVFVNTECCIQLEEAPNPDKTRHWYCDAVTVNFRQKIVHLCEISYSRPPVALLKRLIQWNNHWPQLKVSLARDCRVPNDWPVMPWLFVPDDSRQWLEIRLQALHAQPDASMPEPKVTPLESVVPWKYRSWNRQAATSDNPAKTSAKEAGTRSVV